MKTNTALDDILRESAPQVLSILIRRHGQFDLCEDAVQEALLAAAMQWPATGIPDVPRAWLLTVATHKLTDRWRSEEARRRREELAVPLSESFAPPPGEETVPDNDDTLTLFFMCCHPVLTSASQIALTLRAVGGLTTAEIAHAFLVPEATMAQRISRAKQKIRDTDIPFALPPEPERAERLRTVLHVLYLIFNEGYTASSGPNLQRAELTAEAIRLVCQISQNLPDSGEVDGLLSLMLLTDARRNARSGPGGSLIPLAEQDRSLWNRQSIDEGIALISAALPRAKVGPYQLQAAIAAIHSEAWHAEDTDWPQILGLYGLLERIAPNPVVTLNRAVALAMVKGPAAGLTVLETIAEDDRMIGNHRLAAVRAHLLELSGELSSARVSYLQAAAQTTSLPERRYLELRAARLQDAT